MKRIFYSFILSLFFSTILGYSQVITTNRNAVGLEHNILFNATSRYTVTQTGAAQVDINAIFDGSFLPSYSSAPLSSSNPTIITISGLPDYHRQAGAWVGWSTRYWPASKFKVEVYNSWEGAPIGWMTIADYSSTAYNGSDFTVSLPYCAATSIKFTFYEGTGEGGRFGLSEIFYIHPEATTPYAGLFATSNGQNTFINGEIIWPLAQKNFNLAPREGVTPMSIRLWDNYNGGGPTSYGSLLEIYGRDSHMVSQLYFGGWDNSRIRYRQAFYADTKWSDWLFLLDNKNDVESSGNLKITGTGNHFISNGSLCVGTANTSNLEDVVLKLYRDVRPTFEMTDNYTKLQIGIAKNTWDGAPYSQPGDIIYRSTGPQHGLIFHMPDDNNDGLSYIRFGDNAHPNTVNITNKGFVGIGTFTPEFKLDVLGTIRAWGLKINNKKTADFVFAKDYKLPSLSEVETFVNKNNHLPGIASASEMEKNGVEIGEFQITLLQKIEELTLYSIQLKKDNETQAKANADLQQQLLDMKKELELIKKQMK